MGPYIRKKTPFNEIDVASFYSGIIFRCFPVVFFQVSFSGRLSHCVFIFRGLLLWPAVTEFPVIAGQPGWVRGRLLSDVFFPDVFSGVFRANAVWRYDKLRLPCPLGVLRGSARFDPPPPQRSDLWPRLCGGGLPFPGGAARPIPAVSFTHSGPP